MEKEQPISTPFVNFIYLGTARKLLVPIATNDTNGKLGSNRYTICGCEPRSANCNVYYSFLKCASPKSLNTMYIFRS